MKTETSLLCVWGEGLVYFDWDNGGRGTKRSGFHFLTTGGRESSRLDRFCWDRNLFAVHWVKWREMRWNISERWPDVGLPNRTLRFDGLSFGLSNIQSSIAAAGSCSGYWWWPELWIALHNFDQAYRWKTPLRTETCIPRWKDHPALWRTKSAHRPRGCRQISHPGSRRCAQYWCVSAWRETSIVRYAKLDERVRRREWREGKCRIEGGYPKPEPVKGSHEWWARREGWMRSVVRL